MMKIITKLEDKLRIIKPATLPITEIVKVEVQREICICDFCGEEFNWKLRSCIGCGKHSCCSKEDENFEFEIGCAEQTYDAYGDYEPESDDHRIEFFFLCKTCQKNPPKKIENLIRMMNTRKLIKEKEKEIVNNIIDEIEKLKE